MAAIVMFSKALAIEAKRDGIRVNVLTPSLIAGTPLTEVFEYASTTKDVDYARYFAYAGLDLRVNDRGALPQHLA